VRRLLVVWILARSGVARLHCRAPSMRATGHRRTSLWPARRRWVATLGSVLGRGTCAQVAGANVAQSLSVDRPLSVVRPADHRGWHKGLWQRPVG
jgi:hypothetical protein